jgi:hypothetical protein
MQRELSVLAASPVRLPTASADRQLARVLLVAVTRRRHRCWLYHKATVLNYIREVSTSAVILAKVYFSSFPQFPPIRIIKSMRWAGHVARRGEKRYEYRLLVGKRPLRRPRRRWVDLGWILEKWDGVMWTGLAWLRIGTGGSYREFGFEPSGSIQY